MRQSLFTNELALAEAQFAKLADKEFDAEFDKWRPYFDEAFSEISDRPASFSEFLEILRRDGGTFWSGWGSAIFRRVAGADADEKGVRNFVRASPPFNLNILAIVMGQYERVVKPPKRKRASMRDLMMAVYLPYCDLFVTEDMPQKNCLEEIARAATIEVQIETFQEYRRRLLCI